MRETAVHGVPDPVKGKLVRAAIVLKKDLTATTDEILAHCREGVAAYKVRASVDIIGDLPKRATGKILKRVLR